VTPDHLVGRLARGLTWAAALCLVVMMAATVVDVVLRAAFNLPVFGTFEVVELTLVGVVFLALPEVFLKDQHVTVDVVDQVAAPGVVRLLKTAAALLTLAFVVVLGWNMLAPAGDAMRFGETTLDLKLPIWLFWTPMLIGMAASLVAVLAFLFRLLGGNPDVG
jgi:TRAP-type C4-dicarboxylate transport system permease small subunit